MPKSKTSRTADKYINDLMSELKAQGQGDSFDAADAAVDVPVKKEIRDLMTEAPKNDDESTAAIPEGSVTVPLTLQQKNDSHTQSQSDANYSERTQPMLKGRGNAHESSVKMSYGGGRSAGRSPASSAGQQSEGQLVQAENLKLAQVRILELETEMERLRQENELLASAGSIAKRRLDELMEKVNLIERSKNDTLEQSDLELKILRESLMDKDRELIKNKKRIDEMDGRLNTDLKKVRVRERELENRLELARMEKTALVRTKDETILDLKRKIDILSGELDSHRQKSSELQSKIDGQQEQLGRTVRALRLALTNLETTDSTSGQLVPIKKAE